MGTLITMTREFTPYDRALKLKQLGFNEECIAYYDLRNNLEFYGGDNLKDTHCVQLNTPLFQQAFRWFRENHNLRGFIGFRPNIKQFACHIYDMSLSGKEYVKQRTMEEFNKDPKVGTYEEAELACLDKLIEIVESKKEEE